VRVVLTLLGVVLVAGGAAQASGVRSGLYGDVTRGPISPVCRAGQPCTAPAAGAVLVFSRSGRERGRAHVRTDGTYRIALATGTYSVRAVSKRPLAPAKAWVRKGRYRHVDFSIDTGIR
jgi:hypothetical protein